MSTSEPRSLIMIVIYVLAAVLRLFDSLDDQCLCFNKFNSITIHSRCDMMRTVPSQAYHFNYVVWRSFSATGEIVLPSEVGLALRLGLRDILCAYQIALWSDFLKSHKHKRWQVISSRLCGNSRSSHATAASTAQINCHVVQPFWMEPGDTRW